MSDKITIGLDSNNVRSACDVSKLLWSTTIGEAGQAWNPIRQSWEPLTTRAVYRTDTGAKVGEVGSGYRNVQHVETFERLLNPFLVKGAKIDTAGSLKGGARVWMMASTGRSDAVIVRKADDRVSKHFLVTMAHDGSLRVTFGPSAIRVVCRNTLAASLAETNKLRIKHTKGAEAALVEAERLIAAIDQDIEGVSEVFRALAGKSVTEKQIREFVDRVFPPATRKASATPSPEIVARMDEWTDEPTSPDALADLPMIELPAAVTSIATPRAMVAGNLESSFAALMARPVSTLAMPAETTAATVARLMGKPASDNRRVADNIVEIFEKGGARGDLAVDGVRGTAWAAYNAMTEYQTHERGANDENRFNTLHFQDQGLPVRTLIAARETFLG